MMQPGRVYLTGAGPGDEGLLTVKALRLIQEAEVIIYDRLIGEEILKYASPAAEKLYAGKESGGHSLPQDKINEMLLHYAQAGKKVLRLKGGDPFLFGRGGEEAEYLHKFGVDFEVVPGVTSALAAPAYAGIPLTHRGYASLVTILTGHEDPSKAHSAVDWKNLANNPGTLVILMGLENLASIVKTLIDYGKDPATPVALIQEGTKPTQQVVTGTLQDIAIKAEAATLTPPVIIVIGKVVPLRQSLKWFETKPLCGKTIVITRAEAQAQELLEKLEDWGAKVLSFPVIKITSPPSWGALDAAWERISGYDWIVFTSVNGVAAFFRKRLKQGKDIRALAGIKIAAIGDATAGALEPYYLKADLVPQEYSQEGLLAAFKAIGVKGQKILIPRSLKARAVLENGLQELGAQVEVVPVYQTLPVEDKISELKSLLAQGKIAAVTFTSTSTVENFYRFIGSLPPEVKVICIGHITAQAAQAVGYKVSAVAKKYNIDGLVEAVVGVFR
jgi:uroporphyrinogen III methyltransferase/synthase